MKKCIRLAGCVAFNYIESDERDTCDMFGRLNNLVDSTANGTRGHFSDTCNEVQNMADYRQRVQLISDFISNLSRQKYKEKKF